MKKGARVTINKADGQPIGGVVINFIAPSTVHTGTMTVKCDDGQIRTRFLEKEKKK